MPFFQTMRQSALNHSVGTADAVVTLLRALFDWLVEPQKRDKYSRNTTSYICSKMAAHMRAALILDNMAQQRSTLQHLTLRRRHGGVSLSLYAFPVTVHCTT